MDTNGNTNYKAVITIIDNLHNLDGLTNLVGTNIYGNQVLLGKETQVGDRGIYFPVESQLGEEFCLANDLIRRKDENGKAAGGMFDQNRRVRCQKFKGHQSVGFWIPVESLHYLTTDHGKYPNVGHEFDEFYGQMICQKYIPKYNKNNHTGLGVNKGRKPRESKIVDGQFHFHFDTSQLARNIHKVHPNDLISLTWKFHGTSAIASYVLCKPKLSWLRKLLIKWWISDERPNVYDYLYASRRVIKNGFQEAKNEHYYDHNLWSELGKKHFEGKLHKGESVYYEIVGYTKTGSFIQGPFDYGCSIPDVYENGVAFDPSNSYYKILVYRITNTNVDGDIIELQWNQVKSRCIELGLETVPEIYYDKAMYLFPELSITDHWHEDFLTKLKEKYVYDQDCQFCKTVVPSEGIVLRKEGYNIECFKLKNVRFLEFETKQLDKGEVDMETLESVDEDDQTV